MNSFTKVLLATVALMSQEASARIRKSRTADRITSYDHAICTNILEVSGTDKPTL